MAQISNSILVRSTFILQVNKISKASKYLILGIFGFEMLKFWGSLYALSRFITFRFPTLSELKIFRK